jgi:hypothetical protein
MAALKLRAEDDLPNVTFEFGAAIAKVPLSRLVWLRQGREIFNTPHVTTGCPGPSAASAGGHRRVPATKPCRFVTRVDSTRAAIVIFPTFFGCKSACW